MKPIYRYLLFFVLMLPAFIFRDYTPDNELRYISLAIEALRDGTWFTFYDHGVVYADKPPLYLWYVMSVHFILGSYPMWAVGLASILPAIGIIAIMDKWVKEEGLSCDRTFAGVMLMTTAMFAGTALVMRMDMLMAFFILMALRTFYKMRKGTAGRYARLMLVLYVFLAVFTKGPVGFMMPVLAMVVFLLVKKEIKHFGRYFGWWQWGLLLGLCAVWFSLVYLEGGSEYLNNILFKQTVGRGVNSFHHAEPFYYYITHFAYALAPWSLLYLVSYVKGIKGKLFRTDLEVFLAVVFASTFVMLSLISSKLDIYLVPAYPFAVYLAAVWVARTKPSKWYSVAAAIPCVVFALGLPAFFLVKDEIPFALTEPTMAYVAAGLLSVAGIGALVYIFKGRLYAGVKTAGFGFLVVVFAGAFVIPQVNPYIGFEYLGKEAARIAEIENIDHFVYYNFDEGPYLDIFLQKPLERIYSSEELDSLPEKTLLLYRDVEIRRDTAFAQWMQGRQPEITRGSYSLYIINK